MGASKSYRREREYYYKFQNKYLRLKSPYQYFSWEFRDREERISFSKHNANMVQLKYNYKMEILPLATYRLQPCIGSGIQSDFIRILSIQ